LEFRRYTISKFQILSHHRSAITLQGHIFTISAAVLLPFIPAMSASHGNSVLLVLLFLRPDLQVYFFQFVEIKMTDSMNFFICGYLCNYFSRKNSLI
jgi:hypothetical protein